ncbi:MAG TPA: M23 family peptidase, partial [Methylibium sp.]
MKSPHFLAQFFASAETVLKRHPRRLTAAVVITLLGSAVTAVAVAPLAPDAAKLPRRVLTQSVSPVDLDSQLEALEQHELELYRSDLTRSSDTADTLLRRLGVDDPEAAAFLRGDAVAHALLEGRAGKMVRVQTEGARLQQLIARSPAADADQAGKLFTRLTITRDATGLHASTEQAALQTEVKLGSGTIRTSLFAAADDARIPDGVTTQLAELFGTDIDFRRELQPGDTFSVLYEAPTADGEPITWNQASGRVLAAQFVNAGKSYSAVWFQEPGAAKGAYFGLDGRSKQRFFLASPMAFSRITSGFAMRFHPIQHQWRAHKGVDYGAP